ncbi:hypothetical protein CYMTET_8348 [Cymbomonas tetramitiformis]|uniref:Uncharacterized protein n=1 Tax=Cymbomonas tetramitiformis TaxID=36881 RepID=A0AAE0GTC9_9CHLO|nr:hypothetical protein CYMTET_8348 [Cymbomonas tetramitiformis]
MASRRRSLATIFDSAAARNSVTPATPAPAGAPAANSAQAVFLAGVRSLTRERFDESVAKHVIRKCFPDKHDRFTGTESNAQVLLSKLVPALQEAFEAEDALFAPMFDLEDPTLAVRPEANKLLFSTLELIVSPASPAGDWLEASATLHPLDGQLARRLLDSGAPFQGTSDLLGVRFKAHTDPVESITDFNAALRSAKRRNTLDDDEVKELFLAALDPGFYAPVVSRLFTHQQRAAVDLLTIQQWVLECYARHVAAGTHTASFTLSATAVATDGDTSQLSDLTAIILDVKRQLKVLTDKVNGRGFTPRADKNKIGNGGGGSGVRFAAGDLPTGGNWPQSQVRKRVAFHKGSGDFIPFCQNSACKKDEARHWHRDCPNGGKHGAGGGFHSFSLGDIENDLLAEQFQTAMDEHDGERFDALCLLAGGKPEMLDGVSACSFGIEPEQEYGALQEFLPYCQPATHMGGFTVGGVGSGISAAACTHVREDAPPAPPPATITRVYPDESQASDAGDMMPVDPMHAHEPDLCFADRIARMGGLSITAEGKDLAMRYMHAGSETDSCDGDVDGSAAGYDPIDGEDAVPQPLTSRRGCGAPPWGFGRSSAIAVMVCALFDSVFAPPRRQSRLPLLARHVHRTTPAWRSVVLPRRPPASLHSLLRHRLLFHRAGTAGTVLGKAFTMRQSGFTSRYLHSRFRPLHRCIGMHHRHRTTHRDRLLTRRTGRIPRTTIETFQISSGALRMIHSRHRHLQFTAP